MKLKCFACIYLDIESNFIVSILFLVYQIKITFLEFN